MAYRSSRRTESERFSAVDGDDKFDATAQYAWIAAPPRLPTTGQSTILRQIITFETRVAFGAWFHGQAHALYGERRLDERRLEGDYGHPTEFVVLRDERPTHPERSPRIERDERCPRAAKRPDASMREAGCAASGGLRKSAEPE